MTETFLAILSADNVLRLVSKNGSGIEERAALALNPKVSYGTYEIMAAVDALLAIIEVPEPKAEPKAKPKAVKAKPKKGEARPRHEWLKSSTLIRYLNENPGQEAIQLCQHMCIALGKEYINTSEGYGDVVRSRLGNLVSSGKLRRQDGKYYATHAGMVWSDQTDPLPVADGQEPLAE